MNPKKIGRNFVVVVGSILLVILATIPSFNIVHADNFGTWNIMPNLKTTGNLVGFYNCCTQTASDLVTVYARIADNSVYESISNISQGVAGIYWYDFTGGSKGDMVMVKNATYAYLEGRGNDDQIYINKVTIENNRSAGWKPTGMYTNVDPSLSTAQFQVDAFGNAELLIGALDKQNEVYVGIYRWNVADPTKLSEITWVDQNIKSPKTPYIFADELQQRVYISVIGFDNTIYTRTQFSTSKKNSPYYFDATGWNTLWDANGTATDSLFFASDGFNDVQLVRDPSNNGVYYRRLNSDNLWQFYPVGLTKIFSVEVFRENNRSVLRVFGFNTNTRTQINSFKEVQLDVESTFLIKIMDNPYTINGVNYNSLNAIKLYKTNNDFTIYSVRSMNGDKFIDYATFPNNKI